MDPESNETVKCHSSVRNKRTFQFNVIAPLNSIRSYLIHVSSIPNNFTSSLKDHHRFLEIKQSFDRSPRNTSHISPWISILHLLVENLQKFPTNFKNAPRWYSKYISNCIHILGILLSYIYRKWNNIGNFEWDLLLPTLLNYKYIHF